MKLQLLKSQLLIFTGLLILLIMGSAAYGQPIMFIATIFIALEFLPYLILVFVCNIIVTALLTKKSVLVKCLFPSLLLLIVFFHFQDNYNHLQIASPFYNDSLKIDLQGALIFAGSLCVLNYVAYYIRNKNKKDFKAK